MVGITVAPFERFFRQAADLDVDKADPVDYAADSIAEAEVVNDAVGRFALWGFPDAPDRKLLPGGGDK